CAAQRHDSISALAIENDVVAGRKKTFKPVPETNDVPPKFFRGEHNSAQHRVESRAITTAGQNTNMRLHFRNIATLSFCFRASPLSLRRERRPSEHSN